MFAPACSTCLVILTYSASDYPSTTFDESGADIQHLPGRSVRAQFGIL